MSAVAELRRSLGAAYDLDDDAMVVQEPPPPPAPATPTPKREPKTKQPDFWQGVRKATATTKAEPWEFLSADLGAIFDTRNAKWKEQYYRVWCKHHYPQDKDRWVRKEAGTMP